MNIFSRAFYLGLPRRFMVHCRNKRPGQSRALQRCGRTAKIGWRSRFGLTGRFAASEALGSGSALEAGEDFDVKIGYDLDDRAV